MTNLYIRDEILLHDFFQIFFAQRLIDKIRHPWLNWFLFILIASVCWQANHWALNFWIHLLQNLNDFDSCFISIHFRHLNIHEHDFEDSVIALTFFLNCFFYLFNCVEPTPGSFHVIAVVFLENCFGSEDVEFYIVYEKNRWGAITFLFLFHKLIFLFLFIFNLLFWNYYIILLLYWFYLLLINWVLIILLLIIYNIFFTFNISL